MYEHSVRTACRPSLSTPEAGRPLAMVAAVRAAHLVRTAGYNLHDVGEAANSGRCGASRGGAVAKLAVVVSAPA